MQRRENIERLIEQLREGDEHMRVQIVELLSEIGEPAVEQLIEALDDSDKSVRRGPQQPWVTLEIPEQLNPS
ncbi:HEAT repeat domain-containing protein [Methanothermobacter thermautotrophicus]|uniref:HEAT repeat domain-containing protein n=1 Tax=Methanothermobacter thermautotrophicus TaxID=145262 RepID=UPI003D7FD121